MAKRDALTSNANEEGVQFIVADCIEKIPQFTRSECEQGEKNLGQEWKDWNFVEKIASVSKTGGRL